MRRSIVFSLSCFFVISWLPSLPAQTPNPYKPVLDRLESLTVQPAPDWRYHADAPSAFARVA